MQSHHQLCIKTLLLEGMSAASVSNTLRHLGREHLFVSTGLVRASLSMYRWLWEDRLLGQAGVLLLIVSPVAGLFLDVSLARLTSQA